MMTAKQFEKTGSVINLQARKRNTSQKRIFFLTFLYLFCSLEYGNSKNVIIILQSSKLKNSVFRIQHILISNFLRPYLKYGIPSLWKGILSIEKLRKKIPIRIMNVWNFI
jgi:predicted membrane protein